MTDLNANLNMGFLSSLKDISFPARNFIMFIVGAGPIPPNDMPTIIVGAATGVSLPGGALNVVLVNASGSVAPIPASAASQSYSGASTAYEGMVFNWMVIPATTALSLTVSFVPPDQTQYGFIYAVVVTRPDPLTFVTDTYQVPVPEDPTQFYDIYQLNFSGAKGLNFIPAFAYIIPAVPDIIPSLSPVPTGPDLNFAAQIEGMMGPGSASAPFFIVTYNPTTKVLAINPDQGWFD